MVGSHPNGPPHQHAKGNGRINGKERRQRPRAGSERQLTFGFIEGRDINYNAVMAFTRVLKINVGRLSPIVVEELPLFAKYLEAIKDLRSEESLTEFPDWMAKTEHNNDLNYYRRKVNELEGLCQKSRLSKLLFGLMYTADFEPSEFQIILINETRNFPKNNPITVFLYSLRRYVDTIAAIGKDSEKIQISELIREMQKKD